MPFDRGDGKGGGGSGANSKSRFPAHREKKSGNRGFEVSGAVLRERASWSKVWVVLCRSLDSSRGEATMEHYSKCGLGGDGHRGRPTVK